MDLFTQRAQLIQAVSALEEKELWKGSDAWRAHQVAKKALDQFDLAHPQVVIDLYEQFERVAQEVGQK